MAIRMKTISNIEILVSFQDKKEMLDKINSVIEYYKGQLEIKSTSPHKKEIQRKSLVRWEERRNNLLEQIKHDIN